MKRVTAVHAQLAADMIGDGSELLLGPPDMSLRQRTRQRTRALNLERGRLAQALADSDPNAEDAEEYEP